MHESVPKTSLRRSADPTGVPRRSVDRHDRRSVAIDRARPRRSDSRAANPTLRGTEVKRADERSLWVDRGVRRAARSAVLRGAPLR
ncbi:MAG TPA: hypothetical protein DCQ98_11910 [Planctomycetaceae bacterium]|nr:hypothetical protein [Planctomycetaceae bacterium]